MVRTLEQAIAEVAELPPADQEEIGRKVLSHLQELRRSRGATDATSRHADGTFDIEAFIWQAGWK